MDNGGYGSNDVEEMKEQVVVKGTPDRWMRKDLLIVNFSGW